MLSQLAEHIKETARELESIIGPLTPNGKFIRWAWDNGLKDREIVLLLFGMTDQDTEQFISDRIKEKG